MFLLAQRTVMQIVIKIEIEIGMKMETKNRFLAIQIPYGF